MRGDGRTKYRLNREEAFIHIRNNCEGDINEHFINYYLDKWAADTDVCMNCDSNLGNHKELWHHQFERCELDGKAVIESFYWINRDDFERINQLWNMKCEYCNDHAEPVFHKGYQQYLCDKHRRRQHRLLKKHRELTKLTEEEARLVDIEMMKLDIKDEIKHT